MRTALLGESRIQKTRFSRLDEIFRAFRREEFLHRIDRERSAEVNEALLTLIREEEEPCFLLPAVLEFIERVEKEKVLDHYTFANFELWLNQSSTLSFEENRHIRGKIAGKWIPRDEYQKLFPIGMGKIHEGTHFVSAHKSPDLDSMVASFWGWLDAFAARVGNGLHIWNVPEGPPPSLIEVDFLFRDFFGDAIFSHLLKTRTALNLTSSDLMTQKGFMRVFLEDSIASIDHERDQKSFVIVDAKGFYLGDWRSLDVEGVRQVIILMSSCIRWFENRLHLELISLFTKEELYEKSVTPRLKGLFGLKIKESEPALGFSLQQRKSVRDFIFFVLGIQEGMDCTFESLFQYLARLGEISFPAASQIAHAMKPLFNQKGRLLENRPEIFCFLETMIQGLHEAILKMRERLEKLDIALKTKTRVFGRHPTFVTIRNDVEEIKSKIGPYHCLTVTYPDQEKFFPVGVIYASDLRKATLGTVSLRDFCNPEELKIPPYLEVISVVDHHKTELNTLAPPMAMIADVQSCNTLVANLAFELNDRYSWGGKTLEQLDAQIEEMIRSSHSSSLLQRLLQKKRAAAAVSSFYVHPDREKIEYLHFLYAILNDTDLLSKVSMDDLECIAALVNRLKSLTVKKEVEVIDLSDLPRDSSFLKKAAQRILQNEEMYSLYRKVYLHREKEEEHNLELCARGQPSSVFADTKEQNGCCRVGQTKIFAKNISFFFKHADAIRRSWLKAANDLFNKKAEIALHIHMISTIVSAEEVYTGTFDSYRHQDELWIWIPQQELAVEYLKQFLNHFQNSPGLKDNSLEVEFLGSNAPELALIFKESFFDIPQVSVNQQLPIAVLHFKAGSLNSRKAMVSPFLPTL